MIKCMKGSCLLLIRAFFNYTILIDLALWYVSTYGKIHLSLTNGQLSPHFFYCYKSETSIIFKTYYVI